MNFTSTAAPKATSKVTTLSVVIAAALAVAACSPTGNPQLDMCMKITGNLLQGETSFGEMKEVKGGREMKLTLPYTNNGTNSESVCTFAQENNQQDSSNKRYRTSPSFMTMNGVQIDSKDLMQASLSSSKSVMKDTADETKKQAIAAADDAKVLANEAKDKAADLADDARVKASELTEDAKAKAGEMATKIKESEALDQAREIADQTKDKAKSAILESAKKIQDKLEN